MQKQRKRVDPYMQDVPYDIIRDAKGTVLAEVFQLPTEQLDEGRIKRKSKVSSAR